MVVVAGCLGEQSNVGILRDRGKKMTEQEIVEYCLSLSGAFKRYPFGPEVLIMTVNETKMFCVVYENSNPLHITLKCEPMEADFLRSVYPSVKPGYHFNKRHWNSIYIDGSIPEEEIKEMIKKSHALVYKKPKEAKSKKNGA